MRNSMRDEWSVGRAAGIMVVVPAIMVVVCLGMSPAAASGMLDLQERINRLEDRFRTELNGWRAHIGDVPGAESPDFDDTAWETVDIGFQWDLPNSICWFRRWIEVPKEVGGVPVDGARLALRLNVDNGGAIYVNGELEQTRFDWAEGYAVLTESARPGDRYIVAVRGINRPGWGSLKAAELESSAALEILPATAAFLERVRLASTLLQTEPSLNDWTDGLTGALDSLDLTRLAQGDLEAYLASVARAEDVFQQKAVSVIRRDTQDRIAALADPVSALAEAVRNGEAAGLDLSYQRVTLTVAENFLGFARDDLSSDDLRIVTRGTWNTDWVANAVPQALTEARAILGGATPQRPVPRYKTGPVEIRQGAFWQNEQPLFFVGMGHFGQVRQDIPIFPDYGFNIAQLTISVSEVLPSENGVNEEPINRLLAVLDRAAEHNVAIDVLISPHGWPRWADEEYPELVCATDSFLKYKIDHPKAKAILEKYLKVLIPRIAGHPALFSYCLFNEPSYADPSEYSHKKFQAWLEAKHGSIQTLSRRHGFDYASFDTIPLPTGILGIATRGEKPALASEPAAVSQAPLLYDWYRFNQERFGQAHQWVVDTIHALDPGTPVHSKVQATLFDTYLGFASGIDHEQWTSATDISGNDNWSYYRSWTDHDKSIAGEYASNWWRQTMYYDFQRCVAPGKPVFNSENHPIEDDTPIWVAGRHIRTLYWQAAIHGQGATTTWVWERGDGPTLGDCIITRSNCAHALGTVGLDLLRLSKEIVALQAIAPEIALLVVPSSIPFAEDYLNAMKQAYEGFHFLGAPVGFVTDRQAKRGEWANYKAIIVPGAERISDDLIAQLDAYVADGGTMLVVGRSFASDEYGHARTLPAFLAETADEGVAGITPHGRGKIIYRPTGMDLNAYQQLGEALMADLGVHRPIRVTDEKGRVVTGVEYRSTRYKEGYLLNVVNYGRHELPVRLVAPKRIARVTNLFDGTPARDFLELAPLEPLLLFVETAP